MSKGVGREGGDRPTDITQRKRTRWLPAPSTWVTGHRSQVTGLCKLQGQADKGEADKEKLNGKTCFDQIISMIEMMMG